MSFPRPTVDSGDGEKEEKIHAQQSQRTKLLCVLMVTLLVVLTVCIRLLSTSSSQNNSSGASGSLKRREISEAVAVDKHENANPPRRSDPIAKEHALEATYRELEAQVRSLKETVAIMETDPKSMEATEKLQEAARKLLLARYGKHSAYRVQMDLEFQPTIPDYASNGKDGKIVIEMAPIELIPVSVLTFLEVARTWKSGSFHRNAGHVLQAQVNCGVKKSLPFQEYSPEFPHAKGTTGYCGRPSGPCFYISIQDNTENHGPGSQQDENPYEADANFGRVVEGWEDVVPRIHTTPQRGWLDKKNQVLIRRMHILIPIDDDHLEKGFRLWHGDN